MFCNKSCLLERSENNGKDKIVFHRFTKKREDENKNSFLIYITDPCCQAPIWWGGNLVFSFLALPRSGEKSNKCNQYDYESSQAGDLRRHLKIHSGEKSNKCNQCDFASSRVDSLSNHLKIHKGENWKQCN